MRYEFGSPAITVLRDRPDVIGAVRNSSHLAFSPLQKKLRYGYPLAALQSFLLFSLWKK
jgi:hypothetical protein